MNDTQEQEHKIDWFKSYANVALGVWGIATYLALLAGIAWVALAVSGESRASIAVLAVLNTTCVHWMIFASIERKSRS